MIEIMHTVLEFIRNLTFGDIVMLEIKFIALCAIYIFMSEGIDALKWAINCYLVGLYNRYITRVQKKVEERKITIPYKTSSISAGELIDISSLITVTPKIIAKIDIMTGRIETKEVFMKKRGIPGKLLYPYKSGIDKSVVAIPEKETCQKSFVYTQSLINTLNLHYVNWKELNPELWDALSTEEIVAEEVIIPYLRSFRH